MAKLEGIIYKTFDHYVVLRGFAPIKDLAAISHRPDSYQRNADATHKIEIIKFLDSGEYKYFPEITLACRVKDYVEFASNIGVDNAIDRDDARFVEGLRVLSEKLPYIGYRARHANLSKTTNKDLVRVDGNHRLEPFDNGNEKIWEIAKAEKTALENLIVPYTVIFSEEEFGDKFEAGIFHNINFRQLPLREEASLKIINELNAFDEKENLGAAYPLALKLIDSVRQGGYGQIPWLKINADIEKCYYRTACLRIVQLLLSRRERIQALLAKTHIEKNTLEQELDKKQHLIDTTKNEIQKKKESVERIEIDNPDFARMSQYKSVVKDLEKLSYEQDKLAGEHMSLLHQIEHVSSRVDALRSYLKKCDDKDAILSELSSLIPVYKDLGENYGNIAYLCALVYYSLLDKRQLYAFINWSRLNGINKITQPDDLSKDASMNIITMFDQIHQAQKNEIFISMQFGDSQSELIFEKIVRAIEQFNSKHKDINLRATPIRIDRNVESNVFSIPDRIRDAIRSCGLIIADLSSANINVYHEIGYAMGIAESHNMIPNIILLYKENTDHNKENKDVDKFIGFNLRNLSQLRFKEYDQLIEGLVKRLEKHYGV